MSHASRTKPRGVSRRWPLKGLAALPIVSLGTRLAARSPTPSAMLLTTQVAGFRHDGGNAALGGLGVGSELDLRREPGNVHDSGAIAVYTLSGTKLGYVPRKSNAIPSRLADAGFGLRARVAAIHPAPAPPWERLTVTVEVERG